MSCLLVHLISCQKGLQQLCSALKTLKSKVTHSFTQWVSEWQVHLLSCPGQLKSGLTNRSQHNSRSQEKGRGKSHLWRQKWKATLGAKYDSSWLYKSFEYEGQSSYSAIQSPLFLFRLCEVVELYFTDLVCKREWGVTQKPYSLALKGGYHSTPWLCFPWNLVLPLDVVAKIDFGVKHIGINLFCVTLLKQSNRYTRKCTSISDSGLIMVTFFRITLTQWYIVLLMDSFLYRGKNSRRIYIQSF